MTQSKSLFSIKLLSALIGVSSVLALPGLADASSVRLAQAEETEAEEQELSPEAMEILCKNFPLNSRCSGASQVEEGSPDAEGAADTPEAMESDSEGSVDDPSSSEMEAAPEESMEAAPEEGPDAMEAPEGGAEQPAMEGEVSPEEGAPEGGAEQPAMEGEVSPEEGAPEAAPEGAITPSEAPAAPGVGQPEGMTPPEQPSF